MADTYPTTFPDASTAPAIGSIPINYASDQTWTGRRCRGLLISTAGTLKVTWSSGDVDTLVLAAGLWPFEIVKIWQVGSATAVGSVIF